MAMHDKAKLALRISGAAFDDEIADVISAAVADLRLVGITVTETQEEGSPLNVDDPLLIRAIVLYAKAEFGYSGDSERYRKAYDYLKCSLSLAGEYDAVE